MRKPTPWIEWQTAESEAEWAQLCAAPTPPEHASPQAMRWGMVLLVVLLAGACAWRFGTAITAEPTQPQPQAIHEAQAQTSPDTIGAQHQAAPSLPAGFAPIRDLQSYYRDIQVNYNITPHSIEFHGDQAIVYLTTSTSRQTLFYRRTTAGWLPSPPDAALWGEAQRLETASFVFAYQARDAAVVTAVAPQIETIYATMRRRFGLPPSSPEKLTVAVSLAHTPPAAYAHSREGRITVASPARYVAPLEVSDEALLAQAMALPLIAQVVHEAVAFYQLEPRMDEHLRQALALWQLWALDLPLSAWRDEIVRWRMQTQPARAADQAPVLPQGYHKLCAQHRLWLESPTTLGIPLLCSSVDRTTYRALTLGPASTQAEPWLTAHWRRAQTQDGENYWMEWSDDGVAPAVLFDYIVAEYGQERLPVLLRALAQPLSMQQLTAQVFGVSQPEFEARLQAYLATEYGIAP